jgi:hypothetical protein
VKIPVKFLKPSLPYLVGDIAWFEEPKARIYIDQGFARRAEPKELEELVERQAARSAPAADRIAVRFLKPTLPYLKDEVAWFNELQAAAYIKQGFARREPNAGPYVPYMRRRVGEY